MNLLTGRKRSGCVRRLAVGGNSAPGDLRNSVRILRLPEPPADPAIVTSPPSSSPGPATAFTLIYPEGSYDAEAVFVDPVNADLYLFSKTAGQSGVYRANLNGLAGGSSVALTYLLTVPVSEPSAAAISRDGSRIILRNENAASRHNNVGCGGTRPAIPDFGKSSCVASGFAVLG